jgi:hypothetical protein
VLTCRRRSRVGRMSLLFDSSYEALERPQVLMQTAGVRVEELNDDKRRADPRPFSLAPATAGDEARVGQKGRTGYCLGGSAAIPRAGCAMSATSQLGSSGPYVRPATPVSP